MTKQHRILSLRRCFLGVILQLMAISCNKIIENDALLPVVSFEVTNGYEAGPTTRTDFSGELFGETLLYERIDWVVGDMISVSQVESGLVHKADFTVVARSEDNHLSMAEITSPTQFYWGLGDNAFYGLYPAPGSDGVNSVVTITPATNGSTATIKAVIPNEQQVTKSVRSGQIEYLPDMKYAYMYAAVKSSLDNGSSVHLSFRPLFNAYRLELSADTSNLPETNLIKVELSSSSSNLSVNTTGKGTGAYFTTSLSAESSSFTVPAVTQGLKTVSASLGEGIPLSSEYSVIITLLTLPVAQTNLTLTLTFDGNITKSIALSDANGPVTVAPGQKLRVENLTVPDWAYILSDLSSIETDYTGGTGTLASPFVSYRKRGAEVERVPFELWYSTDDGQSWSQTPPNNPEQWVVTPSFGVADIYEGYLSADSKKLQLTIKDADYRDHFEIEDVHTINLRNADPKTDFDLSTFNVATGSVIDAQYWSTANCYVVSAPGTYKFPLVYGNAILNGEPNTLAYKSNSFPVIRTTYKQSSTWSEEKYKDYQIYITVEGKQQNKFTTKKKWDSFISSPYISASSAELLWMNRPGLVTDVELVSDSENGRNFITFQVPTEHICQGNAIIAARNSSGTIVWSWHIWVTDADLSDHVKVGGTNNYMPKYSVGDVDGVSLECPDYTCLVYAIQPNAPDMIREIQRAKVATVHKKEGVKNEEGTSPYYQWGRKDPMYEAKGENYVPNGAAYDTKKVSGGAVSAQSYHIAYYTDHMFTKIDDTIYQYPLHFYSVATTWLQFMYANMWNSQWPTGTAKSVYDPCPLGFMVPGRTALSNLSSSTLAELNLHSAGNLSASNGAKGETSRYWSNSLVHNYITLVSDNDDSGNTGYYLKRNWPRSAYDAGNNSSNISTGYPIRPVLDVTTPGGNVTIGGIEVVDSEGDGGDWENSTN